MLWRIEEGDGGKRKLVLRSFFGNATNNPIDVSMGVMVYRESEQTGGTLLPTPQRERGVAPSYGWSEVSCQWSDGDFAPGLYRFVAMAAPYDYTSAADFVPLKKMFNAADYVVVSIAEDYTPQAYIVEPRRILIDREASITKENIYQNVYNEAKLIVYNPFDVPVASFITPALSIGDNMYQSEAVLVSLGAGEIAEKTIYFRFFCNDIVDDEVDAVLNFIDWDCGYALCPSFDVKLCRQKESTQLACDDGLAVEDDADRMSIKISAGIRCTSGYYSAPLLTELDNKQSDGSFWTSYSEPTRICCLGKGADTMLALELFYTSELIGADMQAVIYWNNGEAWVPLVRKDFILGKSGVDSPAHERRIVAADGVVAVRGYKGCRLNVHSIDGRCVAEFSCPSDDERVSLVPGIYVVCVGGDSAKVAVR